MKRIRGFAEIDDAVVADPAYNTERVLNEFSASSDLGQHVPEFGRYFVDRYYGQIYEGFEPRQQGIYGRTSDLPMGPNDHLANNGFLRVPFRRIPRTVVRNRAELLQVLNGVKVPHGARLLYRGQTKEHLLPSDSASRLFLYGEERPQEPSLLTSADRSRQPLEAAFPEWALLLRLFLDRVVPDHAGFSGSGRFHMFAIALAQHYGLPTSGLDVTQSLDAAIFFAQMKYAQLDGPFARYEPISPADTPSVVYVLGPDARFKTQYDDHRPHGFPRGRPEAQAAHFLPCSWGYSVNNSARSILIALYLAPDGDFRPIPSAEEMFPPVSEDPFAGFLLDVVRGKLPPILRSPMERFYLIGTP